MRGRLAHIQTVPSGSDAALVFGGRCPRCRRAHVAAVVLVAGEPRGLERIRPADQAEPSQDSPAPTEAQVRSAREMVGLVDRGQADELRIRYLGYRRQALHEPVLPAVVDGPLAELGELTADMVRRCRLELELVARSRELVAP
ncbi:MAG: hypothetical protein ACRDGQ_09735 [Candidatus Limnocylindrales bacterium]